MDFETLRPLLGWIFKLIALTIVAYWITRGIQQLRKVFRQWWKILEHWQNGAMLSSPTMKTLLYLLRRWWLKK